MWVQLIFMTVLRKVLPQQKTLLSYFSFYQDYIGHCHFVFEKGTINIIIIILLTINTVFMLRKLYEQYHVNGRKLIIMCFVDLQRSDLDVSFCQGTNDGVDVGNE